MKANVIQTATASVKLFALCDWDTGNFPQNLSKYLFHIEAR